MISKAIYAKIHMAYEVPKNYVLSIQDHIHYPQIQESQPP